MWLLAIEEIDKIKGKIQKGGKESKDKRQTRKEKGGKSGQIFEET